jgi:hypothetical protein
MEYDLHLDLCTSPALCKYLQNTRLISTTAVTFLDAFYAYAQPANQGDVLACLEAETGANLNQTLLDNGLSPPTTRTCSSDFSASYWDSHHPKSHSAGVNFHV